MNHQRTIRMAALAAALSSLALSGCVVAPAQSPYVRVEPVLVAPPPPRVEVVSVAPYPGYIWIGGYWTWQGRGHQWMPGHWEAPRAGYRWEPHRWEQQGREWREHPGRWEPQREDREPRDRPGHRDRH